MHTATLGEIDRRSVADWPEIRRDYIDRPRPVVITDAARDWPALRRWTPDFFARDFAAIEREVDGQRYTLAQYAGLMQASTPAAPAPYPFSFDMSKTFPALIADVQPAPRFNKLDRLGHPLLARSLLGGTIQHEIFFGGDGSVFPILHFDALYLHTHVTQIRGHKEFFLFPPEQSHCMYPRAENPKFSSVDIRAPDLARHPAFGQARSWHALLAPGETLYFPSGWWHYTRIPEPCISYGGVGLDHTNWASFVRDNYRMRLAAGGRRWKALGVLAYGALLGGLLDLQERLMPEPH